ncbi:MAG: sensor histidine kinase [Thermodesulfovibrio sp.]|nr:sensor histidine kinase [Thermodesulfovibrio sp.]
MRPRGCPTIRLSLPMPPNPCSFICRKTAGTTTICLWQGSISPRSEELILHIRNSRSFWSYSGQWQRQQNNEGKGISAVTAPGEGIAFPEFLASIVHDMKNSLGMILTSAEETVGACSSLGCPSSKRLSQMQYETKRLNNNLVQLLTIYKMDQAQYTVHITDNAVSDFIAETILQNRPLLDYRGIDVVTVCPDDLCWFFDNNLISGVINNILNNAYRYAQDRLRIAAEEQNGFMVLTVQDNGSGYPESMLRSTEHDLKGTSFRTGSTGLGLYFAALVAGLHKNKGRSGYIDISNGGELGGGCFSIYLP